MTKEEAYEFMIWYYLLSSETGEWYTNICSRLFNSCLYVSNHTVADTVVLFRELEIIEKKYGYGPGLWFPLTKKGAKMRAFHCWEMLNLIENKTNK